LVELHRGNVSAKSDGLDTGSEFTVWLPQLPKRSEQARPQGNNATVSGSPHKLHVMVVDDNVDAAKMLAMFLEASGHRVTVVHDPGDALAQADREAFDAFLLDIGLPGMDGNELARRLRATPNTKKVTLVAITGYGQQFDRETSFASGFDHYLVKPADPSKLLTLLGEIKNY
jgi:CheY-like chemotaxis protein